MDLSLKTPDGTFNYRVAAIFTHEGRVLILQDESCPIDYLPGGRVRLFESAETAIAREMQEELGLCTVPPHRAVFVAESCYRVVADESAGFCGDYHEVGVYYLMDTPAELLARGDCFVIREQSDNPADREVHHFRWVPFGELRRLTFLPEFLKERIHSLPDTLEYITCDGTLPAIRG
ncbi:MAG: NUDIX domain-containing protein [Clostridia bacterium]|nr:NUDIX domain-containing protein [Clostridia bacterium]